ncbi:MAG: lamin tail domain-containing protein, partial [Acidobacteria bacterium]|nr:lamin tail domain-containing protein [Acidobacteriota bacterium]
MDEDGTYPDWIELYNTRNYDISLKNWHLTDSPGALAKWTFPDLTIPAYGYVLVFCSGKDRTNDVTRLHANFSLAETGEYLALVRDDLVVEYAYETGYPAQAADISYGIDSAGSRTEVPVHAGSIGTYLVPTNAAALATNWFANGFDDSAWKRATNGIGYDTESTYRPLIATDVRSAMLGKQGSLFLRLPFVVTNAAEVNQMSLRVKFDDGFAAYVNGTKVATTNAPAAPVWNSTAPDLHDDTLAVLFQSFNLNAQSHLLVEGTNVLAIQGINQMSGSSDFLLLPELGLTWNNTNEVTHAVGYLRTPTPGNTNTTILSGVAALPVLSAAGGLFSGTLSITVGCANVSSEVRYTLDGTIPSTNSPLYTGPIDISDSAELLVRAFVPGQVPSPVAGAVYRTAFLGINEFLASNVYATPEINDFSDFADWVELYNDSTDTVNVAGYYLGDNLGNPFRWRSPEGAAIGPKGYLQVWADGLDSKPGRILAREFWPFTSFTTTAYHASFKLSADGEELGLFTPAGTRVDGLAYGTQAPDVSM